MINKITTQPFNAFYRGKKVFITGHTGFKGSWLCLWLHLLGAKIIGYALDPPTSPSLFDLCRINEFVQSTIADVRDGISLQHAMLSAKPDIVIHMAAQPLVRDSYRMPVETYDVNVMGTVNFLDAVRKCQTVKSAINVTTDKCYENKEWIWGYRENDPLGGFDPYSNSKACSELVTSSYRNSYFNPKNYSDHGVGVASARAGNVIGGGDWATDRLIPDCIRAILRGEDVVMIRNPHAIRPWQHVLDPLYGYLILAEKLYNEGARYGGAWNFGPNDDGARPVHWVVEKLTEKWGGNITCSIDKGVHPHEAHYLKLDCTKSKSELGWHPKWGLEKSIDSIVEWTRAYKEGKDVKKVCLQQIEEYTVCDARV
jgi:CDP-glucose 4,6-dehydratase